MMCRAIKADLATNERQPQLNILRWTVDMSNTATQNRNDPTGGSCFRNYCV